VTGRRGGKRQQRAAAIDRAVIDRTERAKIDRTEIDRVANRKEIAGQLVDRG
jgi:hypothetical protein